MATHDRFTAHEFIHHWWFNYDEGHLDRLDGLVVDDCVLISRTERGDHPHEEFIASNQSGREAAMAWTKEHRRHSPYPLRHMAANIHVVAERGDEIDLESYLFVTQIIDRKPSTLSSGIVHWTLRLSDDGYRLVSKEVVLDSIESTAFQDVPEVTGRQAAW
ncbi:MAG: nuclear transport factor 2 family protein [Acidimicrobiales bacterium]|nr:nuclear transport factor 2 family protein [Acidimicrobiales bacterium]